MSRILLFLYGLISYIIFLTVYCYFILWENNTFVPTGIDDTAQLSWPLAVVIDLLLMALFFIPHSIMARQRFKQWWTTIIPPAIERTTYVLVSTILMATWVYLWQPIDFVLYDWRGTMAGQALGFLSFLGFGITVLSTFLINHFEFFGLEQVFRNFTGRPGRTYRFVTPLLYKLVRHPLYLGFMIAFWCNPVLTVGHLLFSTVVTVYTFFGIQLEEKDLHETFGEEYAAYSRETPMLIPFTGKKD